MGNILFFFVLTVMSYIQKMNLFIFVSIIEPVMSKDATETISPKILLLFLGEWNLCDTQLNYVWMLNLSTNIKYWTFFEMHTINQTLRD